MRTYLVAFTISLIASLILTRLVRNLAHRYQLRRARGGTEDSHASHTSFGGNRCRHIHGASIGGIGACGRTRFPACWLKTNHC